MRDADGERDERNEQTVEDLDVTERDAEGVRGGLRPPSPLSGPIPTPYPNTG